MRTILLLTISNIFMTFAWYGHLRFKEKPLLLVILVSWLIALPEYICQVPANRLGHAGNSAIDAAAGPAGWWSWRFSATELKTIQEVITLVVFCAFSVLYLREPFRWNVAVGFALIVLAVWVIFRKW
jgi:hypothetical protein